MRIFLVSGAFALGYMAGTVAPVETIAAASLGLLVLASGRGRA